MAKHKNKIQLMKGEAGFHYLALVVMILLMLFCVVPLVLMLTVSLSSEASLVKGYRFIPSAWSLMPICSCGPRELQSCLTTV